MLVLIIGVALLVAGTLLVANLFGSADAMLRLQRSTPGAVSDSAPRIGGVFLLVFGVIFIIAGIKAIG